MRASAHCYLLACTPRRHCRIPPERVYSYNMGTLPFSYWSRGSARSFQVEQKKTENGDDVVLYESSDPQIEKMYLY